MSEEAQLDAGKTAALDLVALWEEHMRHEFATKSTEETSRRWWRTPMSTTCR